MIKITKKCHFSQKELKLGIPIEMEHTNSKRKATIIAKQHLCEYPNYYSKGLIPMERRLKREIKRCEICKRKFDIDDLDYDLNGRLICRECEMSQWNN